MQVKMLVSMEGDRLSRRPGDIIQVSDAEGKRLIAKEFAVYDSSDGQPANVPLEVWNKKKKADVKKPEVKKKK